MNKVASYLQEHMQGEVSVDPKLRAAFSTDASVLAMIPEIIVYPRTTSDIRKLTRFAWQLAEKGHVLPVTARGAGSDQTGAAIGSGIIVDTTAHLSTIFEMDSKQRLVRLQPGANFLAVNSALGLQGLRIPSYPASGAYSSIGGAVANNASGYLSGRYGDTRKWVERLEIVLANGDVLQTGRLSKRELSKKKNLQSFEGEIYRQLDSLISDNSDMIKQKLAGQESDNAGYRAIAEVKRRDGSFDLTPLFVGSQGTLGIISEIIMKADFFSRDQTTVAVGFKNFEVAHDAIDALVDVEASYLEVFDGQIFAVAKKQGKLYPFFENALSQGFAGVVVVFGFDNFSDRARAKKTKKALKILRAYDTAITAADGEAAEELLTLREVTSYLLLTGKIEHSVPPLLDSVYVPPSRFEDFRKNIAALGEKHHVLLPIYGHGNRSVYSVRPLLQLHKVSDKQKVFKLLGEYAEIVAKHGGELIAECGEGRLKTLFVRHSMDDDVAALYDAVKAIFDPYALLNPGVKQAGDLRKLASSLRPSYDLTRFTGNSLFC